MDQGLRKRGFARAALAEYHDVLAALRGCIDYVVDLRRATGERSVVVDRSARAERPGDLRHPFAVGMRSPVKIHIESS
jgi:DNA-binding IclR family transcriptional regulator